MKLFRKLRNKIKCWFGYHVASGRRDYDQFMDDASEYREICEHCGKAFGKTRIEFHMPDKNWADEQMEREMTGHLMERMDEINENVEDGLI